MRDFKNIISYCHIANQLHHTLKDILSIKNSKINILYFRYLKVFIPRYEVYRGYIVFAFSVIMFVCVFVGLFVCWFVCPSVNFFSAKAFSATT